MASPTAPVRVSVIGLGMVGEWLLRAIAGQHDRIRDRHGVDLRVVAVASRRGGFVHDEDGIDLGALLAHDSPALALSEIDRGERWATTPAGLAATETDVVVEATQSPPADGEPGLSHIRHALGRGISVATSNKWPVALAGVELTALAEQHGAGFRAESTVMSGTPVLTALTAGLGGARPVRLRGVVNATVNFICSRLSAGGSYADALADAQHAGLAERDPSADVDGLDSVAKVMVLSALVFGKQLDVNEVERQGLTAVDQREIDAVLARGERIREVAELDPGAGLARVATGAVPADDPLFSVEGTTNEIRLQVDPLGEVAVGGPGAGPGLAGQGVLSDVIGLAADRRA